MVGESAGACRTVAAGGGRAGSGASCRFPQPGSGAGAAERLLRLGARRGGPERRSVRGEDLTATVCVLRSSTPQTSLGDFFFESGFAVLVTVRGFLCVCFSPFPPPAPPPSPPPGLFPCRARLSSGGEDRRGCARDVGCGIQTMSAPGSLHPVELRAVESPHEHRQVSLCNPANKTRSDPPS